MVAYVLGFRASRAKPVPRGPRDIVTKVCSESQPSIAAPSLQHPNSKDFFGSFLAQRTPAGGPSVADPQSVQCSSVRSALKNLGL